MPRLAAALLAAGLWLLATGPAAEGHGSLQASEPASGAVLARAPSAVRLEFSEPPDLRLSAVEVLDTRGRRVEQGAASAVPGQPRALRVALPALPPGTYTVGWRVASRTDGHTTRGAFAFGVGGQGPAAVLGAGPDALGRQSGDAPSPLDVAGRWAMYWGFALLLGAAATGLAVFGRRLPGRPLRLLAGALLLAGGGLATMAAARLAAGVSPANLAGSEAGLWLAGRGAALLLAGLAVAALAARPRAAWPLVLLGLAACGGLLVHALAGHGNGASSLRWLELAAQWGHLVAVGVWVGGLAWLLRALRGQDRPAQLGAARRFSRLAAAGLAVVVATGLVRTVAELGGWRQLAASGYGRTLALKLALFAGLAALGAVNRFRVLPALAAGTGHAHGGRRELDRLRATVRGELGLAAVVLAAAALLSDLPPGAGRAPAPAPAPVAARSVTASGSDYATALRVTLTVTPGAAGPNRYAAQVADYDSGAPVEAERLQLTASLPSRPDVGPATLDLARDGAGRWRGQGSLLSIAGRWQVTALVQTRAGALTVPLQVDAGLPAGASREAAAGAAPGAPAR